MNFSPEEKKKLGFKYHVSLMCSGNDTKNEKYLQDAKDMAVGIAQRNMVLVNGASALGLMGVTAREANKAGGEVYGLGIKDYEPHIYEWFADWEGYSSYELRTQRLMDIGDVFIALAGGLGTLHEILGVHIHQFLGTEKRPVIIMSPMAELYKDICDKVKSEGFYWSKLPEYLYFVKDAKEALDTLDKIIQGYEESGYINKAYYPVLSAEQIYEDIKKCDEKYRILFAGLDLVIYPDVYPPNRFRSSRIFAKHITEDVCRGKVVFDIGCGPGNLGIIASMKGAKKVVSTDINPSAVENAKENVKNLGLENIDVREGSVFDAIGQEKADVIFFHPPFHHEKIVANHTKLMNSVSTDGYAVLNRFFDGVKDRLNPGGKVYLGFSNKDKEALEYLEKLMKPFNVSIVAHEFAGSTADYRFYEIRP